MRSLIALGLLAGPVVFLAACTDAPDLPDAAPRLSASITGPAYAFPDVSVCFDAVVSDAAATIEWRLGGGVVENGPRACIAWPFVGPRSITLEASRGAEVALAEHLIWDFTQRGEGLRNTIDLLGRRGAAPLHWSASFDEVQDFEHDIRGGQGGTGFLSDSVFLMDGRDEPLGTSKAGLSEELDRLADYVESLATVGVSPFRRDDDPVWMASRLRGEALFRGAAVGCASCHAGPDFTDSQLLTPAMPLLHDVGTIAPSSGMRLGAPLMGLDTPGLRGLWRTAPYLHDGSAQTLLDVLRTRNVADEHGATSSLSAAELADLVEFLRSLDDLTP